MKVRLYALLTTIQSTQFAEHEAKLKAEIFEKKQDLHKFISAILETKTNNTKYDELLNLVTYLFL